MDPPAGAVWEGARLSRSRCGGDSGRLRSVVVQATAQSRAQGHEAPVLATIRAIPWGHMLGQPPAFRARFVAQVRDGATRHELPDDAVVFAEPTHPPSGEKNGPRAPSVPAMAVVTASSRRR